MAVPSLDRERDVFAACLELSAPERQQYLDDRCAGEPALRERIERLLAAHALSTDAVASSLTLPAALAVPEQIGPYRIRGVIGEGGMGTVYDAEQVEPVARRVALKVIRPGGAAGMAARFAAELQTLAVLEHPHIAKVFDAGETHLGQPYFAMEFVEGEALTAYCGRHQLARRERLQLFLQLCRAVEHAHQKGVIHRDLKPANILVGGTPQEPVVKVIDFGIAKAAGTGTAAGAHLTMTGAPIGTPAYMSPEQAAGSLDVDTRSDIYALGVVLYELVTGALPADPEREGYASFLARLGAGDMQPPPPGTGGDLDAIILHALEADRTRRYPSSAAFAEDVERYLTDRPVLARRPTLSYRASKFVRRNRLAVAGLMLAGLALAAGTLAATVGYIRATRAEAQARTEAAAAAEVSAFLVNAFKVNDPGESRGRTVTARELLDNAAARVNSSLAAQPAVRQRLLTSLAAAYIALGLYKEAGPLTKQAVALVPREQESLADADALLLAARVASSGSRTEESRHLAARAGAIRRRLSGPQHVGVAEALLAEADTLVNQDRFDEALPLLERGLALYRTALGERHELTGRAIDRLARFHGRRRLRGDFVRASELYRQVLSIYSAAIGENHPDYAEALSTLADVTNDPNESLALYQQAHAIRLKVLGPQHSRMYQSYMKLCRAHNLLKQYAQAREYGQTSLRLAEAEFGPDSAQALNVLPSLAAAMAGLHGWPAALPYARRARDLAHRVWGPSHTVTALGEVNLGKTLFFLGRREEALPHLRAGVAGGFSLRFEDPGWNPVRKDPRFLALVEEEARLRKQKPLEQNTYYKLQ